MSEIDLLNISCPSNPFASRFVKAGVIAYRRPDTLSALSVVDLIDQLERVRFGAIEGDHGTGKSTLLHSMASVLDRRFPGGRWVQLSRDPRFHWSRRVAEKIGNAVVTWRTQSLAANGGAFVIDGAEQLPLGVLTCLRIRARFRSQVCLITTHKPQRHFVCLHRTSLNRRLIDAMFKELIRSMADKNLLEKTQRHFLGLDLSELSNVRDLWSSLYDWVEREQSSTRIPCERPID